MNRWLRTGVFTGALLCALVMTVVPVYAQGNDAGVAEVLELGVPDSGDTTGQTTWWSTDPCVPDRTPPEITLAGDNPQTVYKDETYMEEGFASVIDVCDGDMLPAMPEMVAVEFWSVDLVGTATLLYEASVLYGADGVGMTSYIEDIFNVYGDADLEADPDARSPFNMIDGEYIITYLVADSAGNEAMAERAVNVSTEPVISLLGEEFMTHECGYTFNYFDPSTPDADYVDPGAVAWDADGTPLTVTDDKDTNLDVGVVGEYIITYTAQPAEGDPISVTRTLTVVHTEGPQIVVPTTILSHECGETFIAPAQSAIDLCGFVSIPPEEVTVDTSGLNVDLPGTYSITYSATDAIGNVGVGTRTVEVEDTTAPDMTLLGDAMLDYGCDDLYMEAGVDGVLDACDGALSNVLVSAYLYESLLNATALYVDDFEDWFNDNQVGNWGEYTFQYAVADTSGNELVLERNLDITCGKNLEMRVAEDMDANFATDDVTKGDGILDETELDAVFARLEPLFPNLTRARFDMIIAEIRALDDNGNITAAAIAEYIGAITPELSIELLGAETLDVECSNTGAFEDPGAAVLLGDVQVATVYTADPVDTTGTAEGIVVTYRYEGFGQPEITVQRTINVVDTTGPIIGGLPLSLEDEAECGVAYTAPNGVAVDSCEATLLGAIVIGGDTVDTSVAGAVFEVTYDAEDSSGNAAEQKVLTVTVVDTVAPVITIDGGNSLTATCGIELTLPTVSAIDACDGDLSAEINVDLGGLALAAPAVGVYTVTFSVTDAEGNESMETLTVTIDDMVAPVVTIAGGNELQGECGVELTIPEAIAADDCDGTVPVQITGLGGLDAKAPAVGEYMVTYEATDTEGNVGTAVLTVTVEDTTAPVVSIAGGDSMTAECGVLLEMPGATALDVCEGPVDAGVSDLGTIDENSPAVGVYQVTYAAQDAASNIGEAVLTITVEDTQAPVVTIEGDISTLLAECAVPLTLPNTSAEDACDGTLPTTIFSDGGLDTGNPVVGVYDVVYQATDAAGNIGSKTLTVTVEDNAGPAVTIDGGNTLQAECAVSLTLPTATAFDACEAVAYAASVDSLDGLDTGNPAVGDYDVVYVSAADGQGNTDTATLKVTVVDTVAPVVTIDGANPLEVQCGQAVTLPSASAADDCDGALLASESDLGGLSLSDPAVGSYTVTYSSEADTAGNVGTATLTVNVVDTLAPVITLLGDNPVTVECGTTYTPPGYSAADDCDGSLTASVVLGGDTVDSGVIGSYAVTYNVSDSASNAATEVTRTVNVVDTTDPTLVLSASLGLTIVDVMGYDVHQVPCNSVWDDIEGPVTLVGDSCAALDWMDVVVTAYPLDPTDFSENGAPITDKSFTAVPGYYRLDYALSDDASNTVVISPGRYVQVDTQCIAVPDVYNLTEAEAIAAIQAAGLTESVDVAYSDAVIIGNVFDQTPAAATLVAPGATVTITVARNVVPDLTGMTEAGAAAALTAVGLQQNLGATSRSLNAVTSGVYDQDTAAGTVVAPLTAVGISVYVPDVIGLDETSAVAAIEAADYSAAITYQWSDTIAADIVIDQPNAGDGADVPIIVSLGKQPSGVFLKGTTPMTLECADGQLWTAVDPLAEVQAGDGTILVDDLATDTLELSDGMGGWTSVDPATDPLVVGTYQAIYRYSYTDPDSGLVTLASTPREINVVDTAAPVVTVYGDNPANAGTVPNPSPPPADLDTYIYNVTAGTYNTWQELAAAQGVAPDGIYAEAVDGCDGTLESLVTPSQFAVYVQYYDGSTFSDIGLFMLDDPAQQAWLQAAAPGSYIVIYVAFDAEGNQGNEAVFRVVNVQ